MLDIVFILCRNDHGSGIDRPLFKRKNNLLSLETSSSFPEIYPFPFSAAFLKAFSTPS
jgi:hypothetical protein